MIHDKIMPKYKAYVVVVALDCSGQEKLSFEQKYGKYISFPLVTNTKGILTKKKVLAKTHLLIGD